VPLGVSRNERSGRRLFLAQMLRHGRKPLAGAVHQNLRYFVARFGLGGAGWKFKHLATIERILETNRLGLLRGWRLGLCNGLFLRNDRHRRRHGIYRFCRKVSDTREQRYRGSCDAQGNFQTLVGFGHMHLTCPVSRVRTTTRHEGFGKLSGIQGAELDLDGVHVARRAMFHIPTVPSRAPGCH